ncbi:MAG: hypothetical protein HY812_17640 [Planctomycetes bacterium]|nr:hypothetical protein [Planctomycetota bacterium]
MFLIHLWKEWRDHRSLFLAQCAIVAIGAGLVAGLTPGENWHSVVLPSVLALAAIVALLLGGELIAGEIRREKHRLLARLPGALAAAFCAKVGVFVFFAVLCGAIGVAVGSVVHAAAAGPHYHVPAVGIGATVQQAWVIAALAAVAAWMLATSCWIRHGSLALPGALVLLAVVLLPLAWIERSNLGFSLLPSDHVLILILLLLAGLLAAYRSFTRGLRHGGAGGAALLHGLPLAVLLCVPAWGWGLHRLDQWRTVDPGDRDFRIIDALLGRTGQLAFVVAVNESSQWDCVPDHCLVVDLRDGSWTEPFSDPLGYFGDDLVRRCPGLRCGQQDLIPYSRYEPDGNGFARQSTWLDGATGALLPPPGNAREEAAFTERLRRNERATTTLRFGNGRTAWFLGDRLEVADPDGCVGTLPWDPADWPSWVAGEGIAVRRRFEPPEQRRFFDLNLGRIVVVDDAIADFLRLLPRSSRWLVGDARRGVRSFVEWDPVQRSTCAAQFLEPGERVVDILDDGVLLVTSPVERADWRHVLLVSARDGSRTLLRFADGTPAVVGGLGGLRHWTPGGRRILPGSDANGRFNARLDRTTATFSRAAEGRVIAPFDEDTALVITADERSLARVRFGSDEVEILFPR